MSLVLGPVTGVRVAGSAAAWPSDLVAAEDVRMSGEDVYRALLGDGWREQQGERRADPSRAAEAWGVHTREWLRGRGRNSIDLGTLAARRALERAGIGPERVDAIVAATCTPVSITNSFSSRIAKALGCTGAAHDVRAGGASGLAAWTHAALLHQGGCRVSLVVAAEVISPYLGEHDLGNALLFADGAAALVLVEGGEDGGLAGAVAGSAAADGVSFTVPGELPPSIDELESGDYRFRPPDVTYRSELARVWREAGEALRAEVPASAELDVFAPYAVMRKQTEAAAAPFGVAPTHALEQLREHGCCGCAAPIATVARAHEAGALGPGRLVGSLAVGGGVAWAGLVWRMA